MGMMAWIAKPVLFSVVFLSSSLNRMCEMKRWPRCSVVGQWIIGYSDGLWGCGDGSPFCVWSRSGYIHAHRATAVVHLVEALITTPPHLHIHTHTHYSNIKLPTWDSLDCCSLSALFLSPLFISAVVYLPAEMSPFYRISRSDLRWKNPWNTTCHL